MSQTRIQSPRLIRLPAILIGEDDLDALHRLADQARGHLAAAAEQLLTELERARIVAQDKLPPEAVRMGSHVTFITEDGLSRTVELVFPDQADIAANRISILTRPDRCFHRPDHRLAVARWPPPQPDRNRHQCMKAYG